MSRAKKAPNPGSGSATLESRIRDPGYWWYILMNLLGDRILVAKAPGNHSDEQSEESTESRAWIRNTGIPGPEHWWYNLTNLLGDHILVAKAPGHHSDEQGEEGTESRIRNTGISDPDSAKLVIQLDELTWRPHTRSQSSRPSQWWEEQRRHRIPGLDPQHWNPVSGIRNTGDTSWWTYLATTYS